MVVLVGMVVLVVEVAKIVGVEKVREVAEIEGYSKTHLIPNQPRNLINPLN